MNVHSLLTFKLWFGLRQVLNKWLNLWVSVKTHPIAIINARLYSGYWFEIFLGIWRLAFSFGRFCVNCIESQKLDARLSMLYHQKYIYFSRNHFLYRSPNANEPCKHTHTSIYFSSDDVCVLWTPWMRGREVQIRLKLAIFSPFDHLKKYLLLIIIVAEHTLRLARVSNRDRKYWHFFANLYFLLFYAYVHTLPTISPYLISSPVHQKLLHTRKICIVCYANTFAS